MQGVLRGDGGGIIGRGQDDTAWASGKGEMELENLGHGVIAADVLHGLSGQGKPGEMPGRGKPRTSGDEDRNAGTFYSPSFPGHRGHFGGGKPPPPTVPHLRHACPLAYTKRKACCHHTVR